MEIKICEDAALLARLNQTVHDMHHQAYPDIFKPYHYLDTLDLFQKLMHQPEHYLLVIETDTGIAAGYLWAQLVMLYETPFRYGQKTLYIHQISIEPEFQHKGYGHALMQYIEEVAEKERCDTVELDYWGKNNAAVDFYEKEGYEFLQKHCRKNI
ncbi:GNAT family N-acetyltransferase [Staphylococcus simulans]|uniref:GNAT family N-acetyltransferase n=1 Tax=Staphylococcus simulans TaxID=1286 RepID=UPI0021D2F13F|nr:GNAT family N-acetyltransferase [Staphylococcus simulans]UXR37699.1 GNAT family N-acetyltransferase [Staphylococcus simulans]